MTGTFNKTVVAQTIAQSSSIDPQLKVHLTQLHQRVADLAQAVPPEEAEAASKALEDLSTEAAKPESTRVKLRMFASNLASIAATTSTAGIPVSTLSRR
ncbi:hypothetical protein [Arthrobacter sp. AZCC_0090]|uniref:hypothetical protein n=1 Tax=Arthrobacter sp. AZCC_0090 TaxID=2735881 RepID=UPI00160A3511|nr:hypothetical protein [Arthrobacter sp. AZCC_0090]MBB6406798.1 putative DNA binding CopG/RHH family protein [Arthrobacter sp. AZCC_0090]